MTGLRLALLLPFALLFSACTSSHAETPAEAPPPSGEVWLPASQVGQLRVAKVEEQPIDDELRLGGRVAFDERRLTHVYSPVGGRVIRLLAEPGERVAKGAPLVVIASPEVGQAYSDLLKAKADLQAAQHALEREKALRKADAGSQAHLEAAEDAFLRAQAENERARQRTRLFDRTSLDAVSEELTLRAPIAGEVVARNVNPGMELQDHAAELFTIGELDQLVVYADLHEQDLAKAHVGQKVRVETVAYPGRAFEGTVDLVSATLDPVLRTARVRVRVANPERLLKPEMYATVTLSVERPPELAVPKEAVLHLGGQTLVFIARGHTLDGRARFERRPIGVDEDVTGPLYPVTRGLVPGDDVVVDGALLLSQSNS